MMNQFEDQIVAVLHENAAEGVDVANLVAASRRRGRAYLVRRRAWQLGGGVAVAVAAVFGAAVVLPQMHGHGQPRDAAANGFAAPGTPSIAPQPSQGPHTITYFRPPVADATSADVDQKVVGADPGLLHFDVAAAVLPTPLASAQWTSIEGLERLILAGAAPVGGGTATSVPNIQVQVSRDRSALDPVGGGEAHAVRVGSGTGTMLSSGTGPARSSQLLWQPLTGVWAEVEAPGDDATVVRFAEAVSFDHVLRCAVPFRLTSVPAGATLEACNVLFDSRGASGMATVRVGTSSVTIDVERAAGKPTATTMIGGRPASVRQYPGDGGAQVLQIDLDYGDHVVDLLAEGRYDQPTVLQIAAGYQDLADSDPNAWPASPL